MLDALIHSLQSKPFNPKDIKKLLSPLEGFDFTQANHGNISKLAELLCQILKEQPNSAFDLEDPYHLRSIVRYDHVNLYTYILKRLSKLVPYLKVTQLKNLYYLLLNILNNTTSKIAIDLSARMTATMLLFSIANHSDKFRLPLFETFKFKIQNGEQCWDELIASAGYVSAEQRYILTGELTNLLDLHGENRIKQKNIVYCITELFNCLSLQEKNRLFSEILTPLLHHKNYYVRQALVEILNKIEGLPREIEALLESLLHDPHSEVVRFVHNTDFYNAKYTKPNPTQASNSVSTVPLTSKMPVRSKSYRRRKNRVASCAYSIPDDELTAFQKSLSPVNYKSGLIKGLESRSTGIARYCLDMLYEYYFKRGLITEKRTFLNIFFELLKQGKLSISDDALTTFVYWKLTRDSTIAPDLIKHLLKYITSNRSDYNRDWVNLVFSTFSENNCQLDIQGTLLEFGKIISDNNANGELRDYLLSTITHICSQQEHYALAFQIITQAFNGQFGNKLASVAAELFYWHIYELNADISLNELSKIDVNSNQQDTIELVVCYLISLISQHATLPLSRANINILQSLLTRSNQISLLIRTHEIISAYGLSDLADMKPILNLLQVRLSKLDNSAAQNAWRYFYLNDHHSSLALIKKLVEDYRTKNQKPPMNLLLLKALNLFELKQYSSALHCINIYLNRQPESSWALYLKGKIYEHNGNAGEAIDFYKQALKLNEFYYDALLSLYQLYFKVGNHFEAEKIVLQLKKLNPRFAPKMLKQENVLQAQASAPLQTDINQLSFALNTLVSDYLEIINKQRDNPDLKKILINRFDNFKILLEAVFGYQTVASYPLIQDIPWDNLIAYPNQIARYFRDILAGLIKTKLPEVYHQAYALHKQSIEQQQDLNQQITETKIGKYINSDALSFLHNHAYVYTAYNFVKKYAFTAQFKDGYALGLSGDISLTYNLFVGIFQLKHWTVSYHEVGVEPSGSTEHTNQFLEKLIQTNKPIVIFVPIIIDKAGGHNVTLDEIKYLISYLKSHGRSENIYFVFDAYNYLPMFALQNSTFSQANKSPAKSLPRTLEYLSRQFKTDKRPSRTDLDAINEHMLLTRIGVNLVSNAIDPRGLYDQYVGKAYAMLTNKCSFSDLLTQFIGELNTDDIQLKTKREIIEKNKIILALLDSILLHEVPWFGSRYQPRAADLNLLKQLQTKIDVCHSKWDSYLSNKPLGIQDHEFSDYAKTLRDLQKCTSVLYTEIEKESPWSRAQEDNQLLRKDTTQAENLPAAREEIIGRAGYSQVIQNRRRLTSSRDNSSTVSQCCVSRTRPT